mmetsp:Transcript_130207/g.226303  ORF Transcript_130207/g.226303 Transcript_130207/m.226303 type:complete len:314 (+) Transcript_130207:774-1715(+)
MVRSGGDLLRTAERFCHASAKPSSRGSTSGFGRSFSIASFRLATASIPSACAKVRMNACFETSGASPALGSSSLCSSILLKRSLASLAVTPINAMKSRKWAPLTDSPDDLSFSFSSVDRVTDFVEDARTRDFDEDARSRPFGDCASRSRDFVEDARPKPFGDCGSRSRDFVEDARPRPFGDCGSPVAERGLDLPELAESGLDRAASPANNLETSSFNVDLLDGRLRYMPSLSPWLHRTVQAASRLGYFRRRRIRICTKFRTGATLLMASEKSDRATGGLSMLFQARAASFLVFLDFGTSAEIKRNIVRACFSS